MSEALVAFILGRALPGTMRDAATVLIVGVQVSTGRIQLNHYLEMSLPCCDKGRCPICRISRVDLRPQGEQSAYMHLVPSLGCNV